MPTVTFLFVFVSSDWIDYQWQREEANKRRNAEKPKSLMIVHFSCC